MSTREKKRTKVDFSLQMSSGQGLIAKERNNTVFYSHDTRPGSCFTAFTHRFEQHLTLRLRDDNPFNNWFFGGGGKSSFLLLLYIFLTLYRTKMVPWDQLSTKPRIEIWSFGRRLKCCPNRCVNAVFKFLSKF